MRLLICGVLVGNHLSRLIKLDTNTADFADVLVRVKVRAGELTIEEVDVRQVLLEEK